MEEKPIGGYFELELRKGKPFHENAICLNSAQNCFEYILRARGYKRIYMPFYTCGVMFKVPRRLGISVLYYCINSSLEPESLPELQLGDAFVYTNYFGLKQDCVERLALKYGRQLIVDNAQAFYAPPIDGIDTFYSPRKFFGVPDGGYLYTDALIDIPILQADSLSRMTHLLKRLGYTPESGFKDFREAENSLDGAPIQWMSNLTFSLLESIDYEGVAHRRKENFKILARHLQLSNQFDLKVTDNVVPMVYPFRTTMTEKRQTLIENKVFVPKYWPMIEVGKQKEAFLSQQLFSEEIIPLPIDQRYNSDDMYRIIDIIDKGD